MSTDTSTSPGEVAHRGWPSRSGVATVGEVVPRLAVTPDECGRTRFCEDGR